MPVNIDNTRIINELKHGSHAAFREVYDAYYHKVYAFAYKMTNSNADMTEDIVQNVFMKVWACREQIDTGKSLINYLCTIAKHIIINDYRRATLMLLYREYSQEYHKYDLSDEKRTDMIGFEEKLSATIEKLPPQRKKIYKLSRESFLSNKEIAGRLAVSESTVEGQMNKALAYLRTEMAEYVKVIIYIYLIVWINW